MYKLYYYPSTLKSDFKNLLEIIFNNLLSYGGRLTDNI